ncbi:DEAD/DEAH box helicase [Saccharopolyspora sp. MS10]|uniref:DEAD/DEAH box helicase n=1 Tax=Saccharopolyspora sp. MS10 TaxID=3385973 RepID=UPI00399EF5D0
MIRPGRGRAPLPGTGLDQEERIAARPSARAEASPRSEPDAAAVLTYHLRCLREEPNPELLPVGAEGERYVPLRGPERLLSGDLDEDGRTGTSPDVAAVIAGARARGEQLWAGYPAVVLRGGEEFAPLLLRRVEAVESASGIRLRPVGPVLPHPGLARRKLGTEGAAELREVFAPDWDGGRRQRMAAEVRTLLRETYRWPGDAALAPDCPDDALDGHLRDGARNTAVLLALRRGDPADAGVLDDLGALEAERHARDRGTALGALLDGDTARTDEPPPVASPWPLGARQRAALASAMTRRLSTVTGPPGTGKSRLAASIVTTAIAAGQRVLVVTGEDRTADEVWRRCERLAPGALVRIGSRPGRSADAARALRAAETGEPDLANALAELVAASRVAARVRRDLDAVARIDAALREAGEIRRAVARELEVSGAELARRLGPRPQGWVRRARGAAGARLLAGWRRSLVLRALGLRPVAPGAPDPGATCRRVADFAAAERTWRERRAQLRYLPEDAALAETLRAAEDSACGAATALLRAAVRGTADEGREEIRALVSGDPAGLEAALRHVRGWAATCRSAPRFPLKPGLFDLVVIDDAHDCRIAAALPLLHRARRAVVLGDLARSPRRTGPDAATESSVRRELGMSADRLENRALSSGRHSILHAAERATGGAVALDEHHRCHPRIAETAHRLTGGPEPVVLTDVRGRPALERPAVEWQHVPGRAAVPESGGSWQNPAEADVVVRVVSALRRALPAGAAIGVLTPFRPQARLLERRLAGFPRVRTGTPRSFGGGECDAVVFSPVAAPGMAPASVAWLERRRDLWHAAVTRARSQFVVVGDAAFWGSRPGIGAEVLAAVRGGPSAPVPGEHRERLREVLPPGVSVQFGQVLHGHRVDASISDGGVPLSVLLDRGPEDGADPGEHLHRMLRRRELLDPEPGVRSAVRLPVWRLHDFEDVAGVLGLRADPRQALATDRN